jgi:hypothetical protein
MLKKKEYDLAEVGKMMRRKAGRLCLTDGDGSLDVWQD